MRLLPLVLLAACVDYNFYAMAQKHAIPDDPESEWALDTGASEWEGSGEDSVDSTVAEATIDASFNVAIQHSTFGDTLGRCQVEVAFYEPDGGDGTGGGSGTVIAMPTIPGTCAYTAFDPEAEDVAGSMNVRGTLEAGSALTLADDAPVSLPAVDHDDGTVTYAMEACSRETFPFARTFDVVGEGAGIPAFTLSEAVAIGSDLGRTLPLDDAIVLGRVTQSLTEPLEWGWTRLHDAPETSEGPVVPSDMFIVRHARHADNRLLEALACLPTDEHGIVISAADLGQLSPTTEATYAYGQIDTYSDGLPVAAPWGQFVKVRSLVSWSGEIVLVSGG